MRYAMIAALAAATTFGTGTTAVSAPKGCPPGLAKKSVPCVPPGQAKKHSAGKDQYRYRIGDRINEDYIIIRDPNRYGLRTDGTYVQSNDYIYQIDRETREVINLIGAISAVLN